jgi:hypothetical protein
MLKVVISAKIYQNYAMYQNMHKTMGKLQLFIKEPQKGKNIQEKLLGQSPFKAAAQPQRA